VSQYWLQQLLLLVHVPPWGTQLAQVPAMQVPTQQSADDEQVPAPSGSPPESPRQLPIARHVPPVHVPLQQSEEAAQVPPLSAHDAHSSELHAVAQHVPFAQSAAPEHPPSRLAPVSRAPLSRPPPSDVPLSFVPASPPP
jgi:hypothetical protein